MGQDLLFRPMYDSTLIDVELGDAAWGDFNRDGKFDLMVAGRWLNTDNPIPITRLFQFVEERGVLIGQQVIDVTFYNERNPLVGLWQSTLAWGDYDNDNDLDLFIAGLQADGSPLAQIYENEGGTTLSMHTVLTGFYLGDAAWGDYDNDGDLDLLTAGIEADEEYRAVIYENQVGTFTRHDVGLVGVRDASAKWGDYDNDGDLDILLAGMDVQFNARVKVYRNEGSYTFVETANNVEALLFPSVDWEDYDADGYLDILQSGAKYSPFVLEGTTQVYRNVGGAFVLVSEQIGGFRGDVAWGDFNSDTQLDYLAFGQVRPHSVIAGRIHQNVGGTFIPLELPFLLPSVPYGDADWGDYDGDGDLDIVFVGKSADGETPAPIYRNEVNDSNPSPGVPSRLQSVVEEGVATLSWQPPAGSSEGFSYNLRVGTTPGASDLVSPMALPTGRRLLSARGNAGYRFEWVLHDLPLGVYYWTVQAINTAYQGSAFAVEAFFTTGDSSDRTPPAMPSGFIVSGEDRQVRLSWEPNTESDLLRYLIHRGATPETETILVALPAGTERYLDTAVENGETYYYRVQAQDISGNLSPLTEAQVALPASRFTRVELAGLPGIRNGSIALGDYDGDGDFDLAYASAGTSGIYRNIGNELFAQANNILSLWDFPSLDWGDYDNDGDLDLAMSGRTGARDFVWQTYIYRNEGGAFQPSFLGSGFAEGEVHWGDYDSDGDLDLLVAARTSESRGGETITTTLFRNDDGILVDSGISLNGSSGAAEWGDYDNDGDLDLVISDFSDDMDVYRNDGGTFTPVANVTNERTYKTIWGDYDNDNDLDLLVADQNGSRLYRNDNGNFVDTQISFPRLTTPSTTDANVDVVWGDYDNNGYLDLIFAGVNFTTVFRNTGDEFLQDGTVLATFEQVDIEGVDFDDDGDIDLLMSGNQVLPVFFQNNTISGASSR
ncbi:MAG TPA: FG-GAP-like repeat-containing protein [Rhodothermales bacterium]|nr:FG-GAP-like repeat-containing protein [Rhodothermales bacterium]